MSSHHSHEEEQPTSQLPSYLRARHVSNIQDDEDYIMDNLHDLNLDLRHRMRPAVASGDLVEKKAYHGSDVDGESQFGSEPYARPDSRNSTAIDFDDESPYPEVRASISNVDDPNMPYNTFRVWTIGLIFSIVIPGANQLLLFRWPSVYITGIITQLVSFPIGKAMAVALPTWKFKAFGSTFSLNPGPFSIKEHVCITIMCNLASMGVYATDVIASQRLYYNSPTPIGYQILLITGVQIVGFAYAGYLRRFVVWPSSMIWPGALVNAALFNTLHQTFSKADDNRMSRHRYFLYVSIGAFLYYWLPGYLFVALSTFNWVCWIAPENPTVNILFGTQTGLGMSLLTFDWSMISFLGSPLVTPWWAQLNGYVTVVILYWVIVPALYFTNTFFSANLPILSTRSFDNTGVRYNASAVVTNGIFDQAKYEAYSPVFMTASMAIAYARDFALFPAVIVHTLLWFRGDIMKRLRSSIHSERDIHSRLMAVYPEVPTWWYAIFGVIATVFLCVAVEIVPTQLPIWATLFALGLSAIISVPLAMLQAITNQQVSLNVMYELIIGYALPGKPIANTIFKAIAWQSGASAISFSGDLKLGHYMKIPPRMMFTIQIISGTISALVALGMQEWAFRNIEGICEPDQKDNFVCPGTNLFATASLLWGAIGPKRLFEEQYGPLFYFFLAGSLLPIPFYLMARRYPLSLWRYINIPIALSGAQVFPPGNGQNYTTWIIVGFIFNYFIRRYHMQWHLRYNYVTSAALDFGTALSVIVIYFAVYFPKGPNGEGYPLNWWGNSVYANTLDGNAVSLLTLDEGQTFGPTTWS